MPLNILDLEDAEERASRKLERWFEEFELRFMGPVVDSAIGAGLTAAIGRSDPETARKIQRALGGGTNGKDLVR
jgi:hypothetical protein